MNPSSLSLQTCLAIAGRAASANCHFYEAPPRDYGPWRAFAAAPAADELLAFVAPRSTPTATTFAASSHPVVTLSYSSSSSSSSSNSNSGLEPDSASTRVHGEVRFVNLRGKRVTTPFHDEISIQPLSPESGVELRLMSEEAESVPCWIYVDTRSEPLTPSATS